MGLLKEAKETTKTFHNKIDSVENKINKVENKVKKFKGKIKTIHKQVNSIQTNVRNIESNVQSIRHDVPTIEHDIEQNYSEQASHPPQNFSSQSYNQMPFQAQTPEGYVHANSPQGYFPNFQNQQMPMQGYPQGMMYNPYIGYPPPQYQSQQNNEQLNEISQQQSSSQPQKSLQDEPLSHFNAPSS